MDELITKPLKRFINNSKKYAKYQICELYGYSKEETILMSDIKNEIRSPKVKYVSTYINKEFLEKSNESGHNLFNDSFITNKNEITDICLRDPILNENEKSSITNNNTTERTLKLLECSPKKSYLNISSANHELEHEKSKINNTLNMSDMQESTIIKDEINENSIYSSLNINRDSDNLIHPNDTKDAKVKKSIIKVKITVPKGSLANNEFESNEQMLPTSKLNEIITDTNLDCYVGNTIISNNVETESDKQIELNDTLLKQDSNFDVKNTSKNDVCIFEENKLRPLSPITHTPVFPNIETLVNFHENQNLVTVKPNESKYLKRYSVPIMGKAALLAKVQNTENSRDSEIISSLVRDRFIINTYESRTCKKNTVKKSKYGRIYKSLERKLQINENDKQIQKNNIQVQQSSPIKLTNDFAPCKANTFDIGEKSIEDTNINYLSATCPIIYQENSFYTSDVAEIEKNIEVTETKTIFPASTEPTFQLHSSDHENILQPIDDREVSKDFDQIIPRCSSATSITLENNKLSNSTNDMPSLMELNETPINQQYYKETEMTNNENECSHNLDVKNVTEEMKKSVIDSTAAMDGSYDMEEFLKKALGDELVEMDNFELSTQEAKKNNPPPKITLAEDSMCTSDASDLISKINSFQSNFYRSLTKKLREMSYTLKSPSPKKSDKLDADDLNSLLPNNEQINELVQHAAVQYESMKQISKALTLCRNTKEFSSSREQEEGERLLLVALHKRQALLNEIRRLNYETDDSSSSSIETGILTITGINLPLKTTNENSQVNRREHRQLYACIFSHGPRVLATQSVTAGEDGTVSFPEVFTFTDLPSDFAINIEIYSLLQRRSIRNFSHASKFHLNKDTKNTHCPLPKSLIHKDKQPQKLLTRFDTEIHTSSFKLNGAVKLRVFDISKLGPWQLRKVPLSSNLEGVLNLTLQSQVNIPIKHSGFLTVGSNIGGSIAWNRRWCVLKGHMIYLWNYPCDEDTIESLNGIDLKKCVNARIEVAERSLCPRPKTLLLETVNNNDITSLERYLFCADSISEMRNWEAKLNTVISALRTWNDSYFN